LLNKLHPLIYCDSKMASKRLTHQSNCNTHSCYSLSLVLCSRFAEDIFPWNSSADGLSTSNHKAVEIALVVHYVAKTEGITRRLMKEQML